MPHHPKPFFRPSRRLWYVQICGKQVNLGRDKDAAFTRYHELLSKPETVDVSPLASRRLVVTVVDAFLDWCQLHRAARTYDWYKDRCQSFVETIPADLAVDDLKPFHVQQWADSHSNWNDGMKRGAMIAIQRAFNWAMKLGHVDRSPIQWLEKPKAGKRDNLISEARYREILSNFPDQAMQDLLKLAWETGARPQELLCLEARHVDIPGSRWVFDASEAKGKKTVRVVYITTAAMLIIQRLLLKYPTGRLLRNEDGVPWKRQAVACRFWRLKKKIGVQYALYDFRHSFCHNALKRGVDPITLANLMGHADTNMIAKIYSKLSHDPEFMKASLRKAVGS